MYYELGLVSVIVAGGYWGWFFLRRPNTGILFGALLLGSVALCLLGMLGRELDIGVLGGAGAVGVGAGTCFLVLAPMLRSVARRFAAGERYGLASRCLDLAEVLAPGSGVGEEKALLAALREIRDGHIEKTVAALEHARTGAQAGARLAIDERIVMLYLSAYRWADGIAHADAHLWPVVPATLPASVDPSLDTPIALRRILGLAPPVWVELVGAYARTGGLERAAGMLARLEDACVGRPDAGVWLHRARLMVLAHAGRVAAVAQLTAGRRARHLGAAAASYWRGVAHAHHGDVAAATAAYTRARSAARGKARELVEHALATVATAAPTKLGPVATAVVARVEAAPPPALVRAPRFRGPVATYGLTAAVVAATIAISALVGSSGDPGVLLRAGAMARTQIHAGEWWRVISCVFVHVGVPHMVLNAISLWVLGRICEELLGTARTLAIFMLAGIAGGVVSFVASPDPMSAGASGAVMGLLGAVFVELTLHKARYRALWKRGVWGGIAIVTIAELGFGFLFPVVDQWAHGGGLAAGALLAALLSPNARGAQARTSAARVLAVAGVAAALVAGVQVARTSLDDSLAGVPRRAWNVAGVTLDAPAAWAINDGELVDDDIFLLVAVARYDHSQSLDADLAAYVASEPERARDRKFTRAGAAVERVVPLPPGWQGSEFELAADDPLGDAVPYRVICAAKEIGGHVVLVSVYAPDSIARTAPEILSGLLATAR